MTIKDSVLFVKLNGAGILEIDMAKKITDTFNGDREKQVDTILRILWAIRNDDNYYFFEYGKDILNRYFDDCKKEAKELVKDLNDNRFCSCDNETKTGCTSAMHCNLCGKLENNENWLR